MSRRRRMPPQGHGKNQGQGKDQGPGKDQSPGQDKAGASPEIQEGGPRNVEDADPVAAVTGGDGKPGLVPVSQGSEAAAANTNDRSPGTGSVHETLLEGVSAEALVASHAGEGGSGRNEPELEPAPEPTSAQSPGDGAKAAPLSDDLTVVPEEAPEPAQLARETVAVATETVETVRQTLPEAADAPSTLPALAPIPAVASPPATTGALTPPRLTELMGEVGEVNTTVLAYLRGESVAAMAHLKALSGAATPADAIRLQVSEMQRAADASLSCFAALARRTSRLTAAIVRR